MKVKNKYEVKITEELLEKAQKKLDYYLKEGCKYPGVSDAFDPTVRPEWFDEERYLRAAKLSKTYFVPLQNSHLIGLLMVVQLPMGLIPLLATGQSKNVSSLFSRYHSTVMHVKEWYMNHPFDKKSKAFKSLGQVRSMHKRVSKLMNSKYPVNKVLKNDEDQNNNKLNERVWVSQMDMMLTQWAFIGVAILEPYKTGFHGTNKEIMLDFIYLWRIFSYCIGIEDRFNLFATNDYDFNYTICKLIFEQIYLPAMTNLDAAMGAAMTVGIMKSVRPFTPYTNWNSFMRYWYKTLNINSYNLNNLSKIDKKKFRLESEIDCNKENKEKTFEKLTENLSEEIINEMLKNGYNSKYKVPDYTQPFELIPLKNWNQKILYKLYAFHMNYILKSKLSLNFTRKMTFYRTNKCLKKKEQIIKKTAKKYDSKLTYAGCPFAEFIDSEYKDYNESVISV